MPNEVCILTTKDFTILEVMHDRNCGQDHLLASILKRKIEAAAVVFRDDVPTNVATLSSRVSFSVDGRDPETRVLSHDRMTSPVGLFLPITVARGLALLGARRRTGVPLTNQDGVEELILLEKVHYQPERDRREKEARTSLSRPFSRTPVLRLVSGALQNKPHDRPLHPDGIDDPGPSAA